MHKERNKDAILAAFPPPKVCNIKSSVCFSLAQCVCMNIHTYTETYMHIYEIIYFVLTKIVYYIYYSVN